MSQIALLFVSGLLMHAQQGVGGFQLPAVNTGLSKSSISDVVEDDHRNATVGAKIVQICASSVKYQAPDNVLQMGLLNVLSYYVASCFVRVGRARTHTLTRSHTLTDTPLMLLSVCIFTPLLCSRRGGNSVGFREAAP